MEELYIRIYVDSLYHATVLRYINRNYILKRRGYSQEETSPLTVVTAECARLTLDPLMASVGNGRMLPLFQKKKSFTSVVKNVARFGTSALRVSWSIFVLSSALMDCLLLINGAHLFALIMRQNIC